MKQERLNELIALARSLAFAFDTKKPTFCKQQWNDLMGTHHKPILTCGLCGTSYCLRCFQSELCMDPRYKDVGNKLQYGLCRCCRGCVHLGAYGSIRATREEPAPMDDVSTELIKLYDERALATYTANQGKFEQLYRRQIPKEICWACRYHPGYYGCRCGAYLCGQEPFCISNHMGKCRDPHIIERSNHIIWDHLVNFDAHKVWVRHWKKRQKEKAALAFA